MSQSTTANNIHDVIVVGAGSSGLYAAYLMRKMGMKVVTVEAHHFVGGRTRVNTTFTQWPVELGGEMIHGGDTLYYDLCKHYGWEVFEVFSETLFAENPRNTTHFYLGRERKMVAQDQVDDDMSKLFNVLNDIPEIKPLPPKDLNLLQYLSNKGVPFRMIGLADAVYSKTWGTNLDRIGVKQSAIEDNKAHEIPKNFKLVKSSKVMIDHFAKDLNIKTNWRARYIDYSTKDICKVTSYEGEQLLGKKVLVTVPLTILKEGDIQFNPELPDDKREAIRVMQMDGGMKILLKFNKKFWSPNVELVLCADSSVPQIWMDGAPHRSVPKDTNAEYVTVGFITGDQAKSMSALPEKKAVKTFLDQLDAMFGNTQCWTPASNAYIGHFIHNWQKDPFVRGAYSFPSVIPSDSFIEESPNHILAKKIDNKIFFAGEATGIQYELGTINGALQSGKRASEEIQESLKIFNSKL